MPRVSVHRSVPHQNTRAIMWTIQHVTQPAEKVRESVPAVQSSIRHRVRYRDSRLKARRDQGSNNFALLGHPMLELLV